MRVTFTVPGQPVGKQRPRVVRAGGGVRTYTPEKTVNYENQVRLEYRRQCGTVSFGEGVPLSLSITAYFQIPKSVSRARRRDMLEHRVRPTVKADADNVAKIIADAGNGFIYPDDRQIVDLQCRKFYGETARVEVTVSDVLI